MTASCGLQPENALRFDCDVELTVDAAATLTFWPAHTAQGAASRVITSQPAATHTLTAWGLYAETTYEWRIEAASQTAEGVLTTDPLPAHLEAEISIDRPGVSTLSGIAFPFACGVQGWLVATDPDGEMIWYESVTELAGFANGGIVGFNPADEDGILSAVVARSTVVEFDRAGNHIMTLTRGIDFDKRVHHDSFRKNGLTFVLNADVYDFGGDDYVLDGVYVFDGPGQPIASWSLADHVDPTGAVTGGAGYWWADFPNSDDFSHANSVWVDDDDNWLVSLRHQNTVIKVNGDMASPDFGEILWSLTGTGATLEGDFDLGSAIPTDYIDFVGQHHAQLTSAGTLLMLDNMGDPGSSRAVEISLDEPGLTADLIGEWDMEARCAVQGGAFELPSGNVLATCATAKRFREFDRGGDLVWEMEVACPGMMPTFGASVVRAAPFPL